MSELLEAMGNPHRALACVHVAGTNGKGSVASLLAAIATASGRRAGLHTSPHLLRVNERLRIDGVPAPGSWLARTIARYRPLFDDVRPSFFEATTALAFLFFAERAVDVAVIETGLGGRLDATNVIQPALSIITSIDLDHTEVLGETVVDIAREKAGIIKAGVPVLSGAAGAANGVLFGIAASRNAPFHQPYAAADSVDSMPDRIRLTARTAANIYPDLEVGLAGTHQAANAVLAIHAAELLFADLVPRTVYDGLRYVTGLAGLRARLELLTLAPTTFLDVAHNPSSLAASLDHLQAHCRGRLFVLFGTMKDKDIERMAEALAAAGARVAACDLDSARSLDAADLRAALQAQGATVIHSGPVAEAWLHVCDAAHEPDAVLATGSHLLAAEVLPLVSG